MGDNVEMILDGILCEECGCYIENSTGKFPQKCKDCDPINKEKENERKSIKRDVKRRQRRAKRADGYIAKYEHGEQRNKVSQRRGRDKRRDVSKSNELCKNHR